MKLGADVAAVDSLSRVVNDESQRLQSSLRTVDSMVATVWWQGPDADRFRRAWTGDLRAKGGQAAEALALLARQLAAQADQQRRASDPDATTSSGVGLPSIPVRPGTLPIIGGHASADATGMVGADADWDSHLKVQDWKLKTDASAQAVIGAQGTVSARYDNGPVSASASSTGTVGADVKAEGAVDAGPDGLHAKVHGDAFLGGKVEAKGAVKVGDSEAEGGGDVRYGVGVEGDADLDVSWDKVTASGDVAGSVGLGGGLHGSVSFSPRNTVNNFVRDGKALAEAGVDAVGHGADALGNGFKAIEELWD